MSGLLDITEKIIGEANHKAENIIENAKKQALEIKEKVNETAAKEGEQLLYKAEQEAALKSQRIVSSAYLEAKKEFLAAKQQILDQVFKNAAAKLASLDEGEYNALINEMSKDVSGDVVLLPRDKEKGTGGGFIVKDGKVEYNFSFEALLKNAKERLSMELASILFN